MFTAVVYSTLMVIIKLSIAQRCSAGENKCVYPSNCGHLKTVPFANDGSPYYDQVLLDVYYNKEIDNVCSTIYEISERKYMFIRSVVFTDGSNKMATYIQTTFSDHPAVFRYEGSWNDSEPNECSSCVFNDYMIGKVDDPKCQDAYFIYRCYLYGDCSTHFNGSNISTAFTSTGTLSDYCYERLMQLACSLGYSHLQFVRLPNCQRRRCVASFNGAKPLNVHKIPLEWQIYNP